VFLVYHDTAFIHLYIRCRNKEDISKEVLLETDLIIFGGPRAPFTKNEFEVMRTWLLAGGRAIIFTGDGGEKQSGSNLNYFLEE